MICLDEPCFYLVFYKPAEEVNPKMTKKLGFFR